MLLREGVGAVLREQRKEMCMTLRELSKKTGISLAHLSDVERGIKEASSEMLEDMCYGLDISVTEVLIGAVKQFEEV